MFSSKTTWGIFEICQRIYIYPRDGDSHTMIGQESAWRRKFHTQQSWLGDINMVQNVKMLTQSKIINMDVPQEGDEISKSLFQSEV